MLTSGPTLDHSPHSLLRDMRYTIVPHQVRGITAGLAALDLEADPARLFPDEPEGNELVAYTRPVICVAAIHCRMLLRFLGLQSNGSPTLVSVAHDSRDPHEVRIEMFSQSDGTPLERVPPSVVECYPDPCGIARAWTATSDFSAQGLAQALIDPSLSSGSITPMLRLTFETIPELVQRWFHERTVLRANA